MDEELPHDGAEEADGDPKNTGSGKKKRTWQKVKMTEYYNPLPYVANKGGKGKSSKGKDDEEAKGGYVNYKGKGTNTIAPVGGDGELSKPKDEESPVRAPTAACGSGAFVGFEGKGGSKGKRAGFKGAGRDFGGAATGYSPGGGGGCHGRKGKGSYDPTPATASSRESAQEAHATTTDEDHLGTGGVGTPTWTAAAGSSGPNNLGRRLGVNNTTGAAPTAVPGTVGGNSVASKGRGGKGVGSGAAAAMVGLGGGMMGAASGMPMMSSPFGAYGMQYPSAYGAVPFAQYGGMPAMYAMPYVMMPNNMQTHTSLNTTSSPYMPGGSAQAELPHRALKQQVQGQVEYYFGTENMHKDVYLRSQMNEEGWVSVALVASFRRIQSMTADLGLLIDAIQTSQILELNTKNTHVRHKTDWRKWAGQLKGTDPEPVAIPEDPTPATT